MNLKPLKMGALVLLIATGVTLLCRLGFWQLDRAQQKETLQEQVENGQQDQLLTQEALLQAITFDALRFRYIKLHGHFLNESTILLDNKTNNGMPGYHVIVPFVLNNSQIVLINRGWIPLGSSRQQIPVLPPLKGEVTIEGYLDFAYRNPFIHQALETDSIQWPLRVQQLDLTLLENLIGKKIQKMLVILDKNSPYAFEALPDITAHMPASRHRGYAVQWFSLAGALLILSIFCAYRFRGKHEHCA